MAATAAKTSPKNKIHAVLNFIALIPTLLVFHRLAMFSGVCLVGFPSSIKREIRKFHVVVV